MYWLSYCNKWEKKREKKYDDDNDADYDDDNYGKYDDNDAEYDDDDDGDKRDCQCQSVQWHSNPGISFAKTLLLV